MEHKPVKVYVHKHEADGMKKVTALSDSDLVKVDSGDTLDVGNVQIEFFFFCYLLWQFFLYKSTILSAYQSTIYKSRFGSNFGFRV